MFEVQLKTGAFLLSQAILGPNTWHEQKKQILNEELLIALKSEIVTVYREWALQAQVEGMLSAKGKKRTQGEWERERDEVPTSPLPHPPTLAPLPPSKGWAVSYCLSWAIPAVLEGHPSQLRGIRPSATRARPAWEQRKEFINDMNDTAHMWLDRISCHVQYALPVPPSSTESFRCLTKSSLTWNKPVPKSPQCSVRVSLQHSSSSSHATDTAQHLSPNKSWELSGELPKPHLAEYLKGRKFSYLRETFQSIK